MNRMTIRSINKIEPEYIPHRSNYIKENNIDNETSSWMGVNNRENDDHKGKS